MAVSYSVARNIDKVHLTPFAEERIRHNIPDCKLPPLELCRQIILDPETTFIKLGKNWNIGNKKYIMAVNASTYVVITVRYRESYKLKMEAEAQAEKEASESC